jgi:hypothetical protein
MKELVADYIRGRPVAIHFITLSGHIKIKIHNNDFSSSFYRFIFRVITKNEIGGECGTQGGQKRYIQDFGGENSLNIHLADRVVDGKII